VNGGALPDDYSCDGSASSPALSWSGAPAGTTEYALLFSTVPTTGTVKYNWVVYGINSRVTSLSKNTLGVGTVGVGSNGAATTYQPPCSQGTGSKTYTFTVYALSASPVLRVASSAVSGDVLLAAIASTTLGSASLNVSHTRTANSYGSTTGCVYVRDSVTISTTGYATVGCDASYAYVGSNGLATHAMMNGITATNLQVPTAQNFLGSNAWRIPLNPSIASTTTTAVDGPVGVAINGVPIFNPCKQGGCQNGDTKALGELDICNGHAGRADDYHYHAAPKCVMATQASSYWNTHPVGWALDGFAIYGYNDASGTTATRDSSCGGNTTAVSNGPAGYAYHVTDTSPYILSCLVGTPSPDFAGQSAKYTPIRKPPVTPFPVTGMTLSTASDGYQELQFTSATSFVATETGTDSYTNSAGTYKIRYKQLSGSDLVTALASRTGSSLCWSFQFVNSAGTTTQAAVTYCH